MWPPQLGSRRQWRQCQISTFHRGGLDLSNWGKLGQRLTAYRRCWWTEPRPYCSPTVRSPQYYLWIQFSTFPVNEDLLFHQSNPCAWFILLLIALPQILLHATQSNSEGMWRSQTLGRGIGTIPTSEPSTAAIEAEDLNSTMSNDEGSSGEDSRLTSSNGPTRKRRRERHQKIS